ncbi:MAG TPA: hypothetical protein VFG78_09790 [Gemmatimonadota bacterium]|nr:hypothetical protein [Gemmatimonadota bacterium]
MPPPARTTAFLLVTVAGLVLPGGLRGQERPLRTEDPNPIPAGAVLLETGADLEFGRRFPLSGLEGDLYRLPYLGFSFGLGDVAEFQVDAGFNLLHVQDRDPAPLAEDLDFTGDTTTDIEDPVVATKLRLIREGRRRPAVALRVATRIPSASNESGIGTDTIDWYMSLLAGKSVGDLRILANFGLGVLPFPLQGDRQNDVLTGGLALLWRAAEDLDLVGEVNGRIDVKGSTPAGTEDRGQARLGARLGLGRLFGAGVRLDGGVVAGLTDVDPGIGATLGLTLLDRSF